ncbi:MAG TPA: DUF6498-containing protein [Marmoricola sp.]|nr:DUF6498-containing protein [Marmoricola sp.]
MAQQFRYPSAPTTGTTKPARAVSLSMLVLVVMNLLPIVGVLKGDLTLGDVFVVYWLENVIVGALTVVRILTAGEAPAGPSRWFLAPFFCVHYGIFTAVHGVFTGVLVAMVGGTDELSPAAVLGGAAALALSHLVSLGWNWFRQDERSAVTPSQAMTAPYPRMVVLHVAVIASFFLLFALLGAGPGDPFEGTSSLAGSVGPVVILCALKTVLDASLHAREHHAGRRPEPARNI